MATQREQLEAQRSRMARSDLAMADAIRMKYFNEMCDCGHTRGAHVGLYGESECLGCSCVRYTSQNTGQCNCGHARVEHNQGTGECWRIECECRAYRSLDAVVDKWAETPSVPQEIVPVRDDVTSYPVTGYIVKDEEGWFVGINRLALPSVRSWPRRYAWCVRCQSGPYGANGRSLNKSGLWQFTTGMDDDELLETVAFDTPEEAYQHWTLFQEQVTKMEKARNDDENDDGGDDAGAQRTRVR